jgi:hypothetical protein
MSKITYKPLNSLLSRQAPMNNNYNGLGEHAHSMTHAAHLTYGDGFFTDLHMIASGDHFPKDYELSPLELMQDDLPTSGETSRTIR